MDVTRRFVRMGRRTLVAATVVIGACASAAPPEGPDSLPALGEASVDWQAAAALSLRGSGVEWRTLGARQTTIGLYAGGPPAWARREGQQPGPLPGDEDAGYGLYVMTRF